MIRMLRDEYEGRDFAPPKVLESMPLYGIERMMGVDDSIPSEGPVVKFRMYDDDGERMCSGELTDDEDCENQSAALRWGESYYGCTVIKVRRGAKWVQEIG